MGTVKEDLLDAALVWLSCFIYLFVAKIKKQNLKLWNYVVFKYWCKVKLKSHMLEKSSKLEGIKEKQNQLQSHNE